MYVTHEDPNEEYCKEERTEWSCRDESERPEGVNAKGSCGEQEAR